MSIRHAFKEFFAVMSYIKPSLAKYITGLTGHFMAQTIILISQAFMFKYVLDGCINGDANLVIRGTVIVTSVCVISCILYVICGNIFFKCGQKTTAHIRTKLFEKLQALPVTYFENNHSGDILSRMTNDMQATQGVYSWTIRNILYTLTVGIGSAITMFILDWRISFLLIGIGVVTIVINAKFIKTVRGIGNKLQKSLGQFTEGMSNIFAGFTVIKLFDIEKILDSTMNKYNDDIKTLAIEKSRTNALTDSCNFVISWINFSGIIAIGAILVAHNITGFGTMFALMELLRYVNSSIKRLGANFSAMQSNLAGAARVLEILNEQEEAETYNIKEATDINSGICLQNVSFSYMEGSSVLDSLCLNVEKGQMAALVGPSGAGKSTIFKILLGFYRPSAGNISINGMGLDKYNLSDLREKIAYVSQESFLFNGTVEENIRLGNTDATRKEIVEAAKAAYADEFIQALPQGYDTIVGERGSRLSGGQQQRIAIARAFLKNAPILLLDEATSSLDSQSEQYIQQAIDTLTKNKTVLIIAHRLSTIRKADIIYVIRDGCVIERGSHTDLLSKSEVYSMLYNKQFA